MSTPITIVGNVGSAELKFTAAGKALLSLSVAHNRRRVNPTTREWEDAGTDWYRCSLWGERAEAAVETVVKGARVVVVGELESREYAVDGATRTAWEIRASDVGVVARASGGRVSPAADPWATTPAQDVAPW